MAEGAAVRKVALDEARIHDRHRRLRARLLGHEGPACCERLPEHRKEIRLDVLVQEGDGPSTLLRCGHARRLIAAHPLHPVSQGEAARQRRRRDAGERCHVLAHSLHIRVVSVRIGFEVEPGHDEPCGIEAEILGQELVRAAQEQARSEEEHYGEGHLRDGQRDTRVPDAHARALPAAALLQHLVDTPAPALQPQRTGGECRRRHAREQRDENQRRAVDGDGIGRLFGHEAKVTEELEPGGRKSEPEARRCECEERRLDQVKPRHPSGARSQCGQQRTLVRPGGEPRDVEVAGVDDRDRHDEERRAQHQLQDDVSRRRQPQASQRLRADLQVTSLGEVPGFRKHGEQSRQALPGIDAPHSCGEPADAPSSADPANGVFLQSFGG